VGGDIASSKEVAFSVLEEVPKNQFRETVKKRRENK
jgi:hypothetical protein